MMGMNAPEWSAYMRDVRRHAAAAPEEINAEVVRRMRDRYHEGASRPGRAPSRQSAASRGARLRLAVASSSNRELIEAVLETARRLTDSFRGRWSRPRRFRAASLAPDVYLEVDAPARASTPVVCAAVEDSTNGLLAAVRRRAPPSSPTRTAASRRRSDALRRGRPRRRDAGRAHARDAVGLRGRRLSVSRRGRAGRRRCGRRGPSRSRARRRPRPGAPRSGRSRGRTPGPGSGS